MARTILAVTAALALLAAAAPAGANDSMSGLTTGGLVLTKSADVAMRSEDLYISPTQVRVAYRFANTTPHDITATVAFPLPDITTEGYDDMLVIPRDSATDFMGFTTLVDGKPVQMRVEQKAVQKGIDRTAYLRGLGVPLSPQRDATNRALNKLPKAKRDALVKQGLAINLGSDVGEGMKYALVATWTLKTTFWWTQTFPAGRELAVQHRYTPSVGTQAGTFWGNDAPPTEPYILKQKTDYCIDDDVIAGIRAAHKAAGDNFGMNTETIGYVLVTGANWEGPIGDFHMTIDKGSTKTLVAFCGDGVRKTGPTTFEVRYTNFTPKRDVKIMLFAPPGG